MEESNAWEFQEEGITIASKLNIGQNELYRSIKTLSGGQKKRVALAAALLKVVQSMHALYQSLTQTISSL